MTIQELAQLAGCDENKVRVFKTAYSAIYSAGFANPMTNGEIFVTVPIDSKNVMKRNGFVDL